MNVTIVGKPDPKRAIEYLAKVVKESKNAESKR